MMYKLSMHPNVTILVLALATGLLAVTYLPQIFPDLIVEMPLIAFFAGEIGLSLLLALLFYENASTEQAVQVAACMIGFTMLVGVVGNVWGAFVGEATRMLPDSFVLISWVQLAIMNVAGLFTTLCLMKLELKEQYKFVVGTIVKETEASRVDAIRRAAPQDVTAKVPEVAVVPEVPEDFVIPRQPGADVGGAHGTESAQGILDKLDSARIEALEKQVNPQPVSLEQLFGDESRAAQAAKDAVSEMVAKSVATDAKGKELKDFGRLNRKAAHPDSQPPGTMRTIGKMLLDPQAVETLIRTGEQGGLPTAKIISADKGEALNASLKKINAYPGVTGSLIVGHDGLVVASTLESDMDSFTQGAMALAVFSPTGTAIKKIEYGKLNQMIVRSADKLTIFCGSDSGILVVFSDYTDTSAVAGLLEAVTGIATGS